MTRVGNELQAIGTVGVGGGNGAGDVRLDDWEQVLIAIVEPSSPRVVDPGRTASLLEHLLGRAGIDSDQFWSLDRAQRARLFLECLRPSVARRCRSSRSAPSTSTSCSRSASAASRSPWARRGTTATGARTSRTRPSPTPPTTACARSSRRPGTSCASSPPSSSAERQADARLSCDSMRLDMPMIVGPLPFAEGCAMEAAYLEATAAPRIRGPRRAHASLVVIEAASTCVIRRLSPFAPHLLVRLGPRELAALDRSGAGGEGERRRSASRPARCRPHRRAGRRRALGRAVGQRRSNALPPPYVPSPRSCCSPYSCATTAPCFWERARRGGAARSRGHDPRTSAGAAQVLPARRPASTRSSRRVCCARASSSSRRVATPTPRHRPRRCTRPCCSAPTAAP